MEPCGRDRQHHLPPGIGKLWEAVEEQDTGPILYLEAGFQRLNAEAVDVAYKPGAYAGRKNGVFQGHQLGHLYLPCFVERSAPPQPNRKSAAMRHVRGTRSTVHFAVQSVSPFVGTC